MPAPRARAALAALGAASLCVYALGITARYPLLPGLQVPRGTWTTLVGTSPAALALHVGVYALLTLLYLLALGAARRGATPSAAPVIVGVWLACSLALLGAYPGGESHDIFDYTFRGRMMAEHGASPLAVTPDAFSREPYYLYISWHGHVDTYGPLWEYASAAVAAIVRAALRLAGISTGALPTCPDSAASCAALVAHLTGYRLLAISLAGLTGGLIFTMVRRASPGEAQSALLAWLWNPTLLVATAIGAHNDALLMALVMLALSLLQSRRVLAGLLVFALAAHVKLTALLLAPALAVWVIRREGVRPALRRAALALAVAAPASLLLYAPLGGWATLPRMLYERGLFLAASPANVVYRWLYDTQGWGAPDARTAVQQGASLLFAGIALILLARLAAGPADSEVLWRAAAGLSLAYVLVGSFWFQHWYLLWVLAPAALRPHTPLVSVVLPWYGLGALCANVAAAFFGAFSPAPSRLALAAIEAAIIIGPLAVALLVRAAFAARSAPARITPKPPERTRA